MAEEDRAAPATENELDLPPVEEIIGYLLRRANQIYHQYWQEKFRAPNGALTAMQAGMLAAIGQWGPVTQAELARRIQIKAPTALRLITHLEELKYVQRNPRDDDRRSYTLSITPSGAKILALVSEMVPQRDNILLNRLTDAERQWLRSILERIVFNGKFGED